MNDEIPLRSAPMSIEYWVKIFDRYMKATDSIFLNIASRGVLRKGEKSHFVVTRHAMASNDWSANRERKNSDGGH